MKKILVILCAIFAINLSAKAQLTTADSIWTVIKNETTRGANTATRIGSAGNYIVAGVRDTLANFSLKKDADSTFLSISIDTIKTGNQVFFAKGINSFNLYGSDGSGFASLLNTGRRFIYGKRYNPFILKGKLLFQNDNEYGVVYLDTTKTHLYYIDDNNKDAVLIEESAISLKTVSGDKAIEVKTDTIYPYKPIKGYFTAAQISDSLAQTVKITGYQNIEGTKNFTKILADTIGVSDYLSSHEITTSILGADAINSSEISTYEIETAKIKVNDTITSAFYSVSELNEAPASATAEGKTGEIRITAGFIYVCVSDDVWVRATLATW